MRSRTGPAAVRPQHTRSITSFLWRFQRNLALAERDGHKQLFAPCPLCSMQLLKVQKALAGNRLRAELSQIVEADLRGDGQVLNLIQLLQTVGLDKLKAAVKAPLNSISAACYYGCLLTRPPNVVHFDDFEQPKSMEAVLAVLGAQTVEWNFKTECCGAGMTMCSEETVLDLAHKILSNAAAHGANCVVVACPMCHVNLYMKQAAVEHRYSKNMGVHPHAADGRGRTASAHQAVLLFGSRSG